MLMKLGCHNCWTVWDKDSCPEEKCPQCKGRVHRLPGIMLRWKKLGAHFHVTVFMGDDLEHMGNCGTLRLRAAEWRLLRNSFLLAADAVEFGDKFEIVVQKQSPEEMEV